MVYTDRITIDTSDEVPEITDITKEVEKVAMASKVKEGQVLIYSQHTTAAIIIQEDEKGLFRDIKKCLQTLCPTTGNYNHADSPDHLKDGLPNAHSHLQHILLGGPSERVPISKGKMLLGTYQRILLLELDHGRKRDIIVQVIGG